MNQKQRGLIREALELKALQEDEDTSACLELLEQVHRIEFRAGRVPPPDCQAPVFVKGGCPKCSSPLEVRVFDTGRWPYCPRCAKKRYRALSAEDAVRFQAGELKL